MEYVTILISLLLLVIILLRKKRRFLEPYEAVTSLLTSAEQRFYRALQSILGEQVIILAKVRVADLMNVKSSISGKSFWKHFSRISQKHVDFVILDSQKFTTLCLIELDDKSHNNPERIKRDRFIDRITIQTGLPLYRIPVQSNYNMLKLSGIIQSLIRKHSIQCIRNK